VWRRGWKNVDRLATMVGPGGTPSVHRVISILKDARDAQHGFFPEKLQIRLVLGPWPQVALDVLKGKQHLNAGRQEEAP
jgi:hypothetical protein